MVGLMRFTLRRVAGGATTGTSIVIRADPPNVILFLGTVEELAVVRTAKLTIAPEPDKDSVSVPDSPMPILSAPLPPKVSRSVPAIASPEDVVVAGFACAVLSPRPLVPIGRAASTLIKIPAVGAGAALLTTKL